MENVVVAALYQFKALTNLDALQKRLTTLCQNQGIKGTLLLAHEGINGTVAGSRAAIDALKKTLGEIFDDLEYKESFAESMPFHRMKVRIKKEIVTLGQAEADPSQQVGTYVDAEEWNRLIADPDVLLIDTRNDYEVEIGTFRGAQNPHTTTFKEFPAFVENLKENKDKRVAMFCTGGIRCEKASAYMLSQGFKNVYHLKGGILRYLENIPEEKSLWDGDCFVFDGRVAVSHGLALGHYEMCFGCRHPLSLEDRASSLYERGVSCPHCAHDQTDEKRKAARQRQQQEDLARERGGKHVGAVMPHQKSH